MGVKKAKPIRKNTELAQQSTLEVAKEWAAKNTGAAIGVALAVVVAAMLLGGYFVYESSSLERARAAYGLIAARLPGEGADNAAEWNKVIPDLRRFIAGYGNSAPTLDAKMNLARGYFETGSYALAVETWQEALKAVSSDSSLKPLILYQLGYGCQAAGKPEEALKAWAELRRLKSPALEREADWNLGRIYQEKKELAKAVEMFALASQAPGEYPPGPQIDERLAAIKIAKAK
ncbi:MAG: tetratricopeptide repeat protein [Syntrophobacteraceae bacterium]|nr:tetratricopeptide repeat protein [Syntrophobacteraceae bacterium]